MNISWSCISFFVLFVIYYYSCKINICSSNQIRYMVKYILSIILYFIFKLFTSLIILPTSQKTTITVLLCFFIRHRVQVQAQQQTCWHPHFLSAVTAATTPDPTHLWYWLSSHHQHHNGNSNWDERTYHEDSDMRTTTWGGRPVGRRHEDDDDYEDDNDEDDDMDDTHEDDNENGIDGKWHRWHDGKGRRRRQMALTANGMGGKQRRQQTWGGRRGWTMMIRTLTV